MTEKGAKDLIYATDSCGSTSAMLPERYATCHMYPFTNAKSCVSRFLEKQAYVLWGFSCRAHRSDNLPRLGVVLWGLGRSRRFGLLDSVVAGGPLSKPERCLLFSQLQAATGCWWWRWRSLYRGSYRGGAITAARGD